MNSGKVFFTVNNLYKISAMLFVLLNYSCVTQNPVSAQSQQGYVSPQGYVSTQVFYDQLSPYGEWIENPNYGYVWIPDVDQDFSPYSTSGYWVMTDYGWTWVSDYPWGWATFHYGRWDYNDYYGWYWVPDNEWGPSWVTWRTGNGYYGWAPMRPGISIGLSFGNDYQDINRWNFVRERDFGRPDMYRYYADRNEYNTIIINSTVINNTYVDRSRNTTYITGPSRNDVQRVTGRKINNISVRDNDRPGEKLNNSQLQIYRPRIQKNSDRAQQPAPYKITNQNEVRSTRERNNSSQQGKVSPSENYRREEQQSQPQRQNEDQRQSQPAQQPERRNQDQRQQPQQQDQRRQDQQQQDQQQIERQNQQKQKQQINNRIDEQVKQQQLRTQQQDDRRKQAQQQQVEKQQQDQQRQVQQQQQKQEIRNQEQQVKQQKEQQRQAQKQQVQEQKQVRKTEQQQQRKQETADPADNKKDDSRR